MSKVKVRVNVKVKDIKKRVLKQINNFLLRRVRRQFKHIILILQMKDTKYETKVPEI